MVTSIVNDLQEFEDFDLAAQGGEQIFTFTLLLEKLMRFIQMSDLLVSTKLVPAELRYPFEMYF